jgi:TM2 domain-containing membrane protein YozV
MFQAAAAPVPQSIVNVHVAAPTMRRWSRGTAILLSLIVPGLGQAYKGQIINGLVWFVVTIAGYIMLIVPGVILHILCLVGASWGDETR